MLKLQQIVKDYQAGDTTVHALRGVSLQFRESEFVAILGHSGCGKTTLLNIIGGLDQYTSGDLVINGKSTKDFSDSDWDSYRNHSIGFVFQSYNLIPHQTVLANVELALTLSGVAPEERRRRAAEALEKVGLGDQLLRLSWRGNADYKPFEETRVRVKMVDNRQPTEVVLKPSISLIYNKDVSVVAGQIFEYVINWDDSKLPEKDTLSADDFTFEYEAEVMITDKDGLVVGTGEKRWAPIAGEKVLTSYTFCEQIGAGEQKIRVTYKGNADYRPSNGAELPKDCYLTIKKAPVTVKVHSTSIYADEELSKDFITTDPVDNFDIFTVFGGVTNNVTGSVFVQLPERLTKGTIIKLIDKTLEGLGQKTLTQMMQEGMTVGELRKLFNDIVTNADNLPQSVKELLAKAGIDIDTLVKLNEALNKFPNLLDDVRVAFGTPDQAGIYTVCAVTNNKNYHTSFAMGSLVVKAHVSDVRLTWNAPINGKLTVEEAAAFDFGATLRYNEKPVADQSSVKCLYTGITSNWQSYSCTTTPPTEPGRYVMTVVTLGGNYQAAPITRSFQITK